MSFQIQLRPMELTMEFSLGGIESLNLCVLFSAASGCPRTTNDQH